MNTLEWKSLHWSGKTLLINQNEVAVGRLTFNNSWYSNAEYNSRQRKTKFIQKNFLSQSVKVMLGEILVGEIKLSVFGNQVLTLKSGEEYRLCSDFLGRSIRWIDSSGQLLIKYNQPTMTSFTRGTIETITELPDDQKDILLSSGLFIKTLVVLKAAFLGAIVGVLITKLFR
jgi:hypothetical protein